ncbi:MAG: 2-C-methyl-D-erythritol 4-phosphate cytidylyltransferase [Gammaproteobacteria bacterium]
MQTKAKFWAIVPAAGAGTRMGSDIPKQYLTLGDRTVLEHTLDTLLSCQQLAGVILVLSPADQRWTGIQQRYAQQALETVNGGAERCDSVLNGLKHLAARATDDDWVLVHDAARPCVRAEDIERLMKTLESSDEGGLLGVPVADTMKRVDDELCITDTVDREGLWHAYTPQMFPAGALRTALQQAIGDGYPVTDEANAMELAGYRPRMVQGARDNIKITVPSDLPLAAFYLQSRQSS